MNLFRFYKAVADDHEERDGSYVNYDWLLRKLEEEDHPHYGPPLPPSVLDRVLREDYAPAMRAALHEGSALLDGLVLSRVERGR